MKLQPLTTLRMEEERCQTGWRSPHDRGSRPEPHQKGSSESALGREAHLRSQVEADRREGLSPRQRHIARQVDDMLILAKMRSPTWHELKEQEEGKDDDGT